VTTLAEPQPPFLTDEPALRLHTRRSRLLRRLRHQPAAITALALLLCLLVVGALAPQLAPHGWNDLNLNPRWQNHPPTLASGHLLGTDNIGRDVLVRTLYGLHTSERAALLAALLALLLGLAVGGIAGYYGGWLDAILMRLADLVTAFPALMLLYAAYIFLEPVTIWTATAIFALYMWTIIARVTRANIATLRESEFVQAARALGATDLRIFFRHLLPNTAGTITVAATALIGQVILLEATVEFFGLGVPSQTQPSLGNLIGDATATGIGSYNQLGLGWWVWATPATILVTILICLNLIGDGINTALDPTGTPR
jgi:peptide/nickel transport system permease protein